MGGNGYNLRWTRWSEKKSRNGIPKDPLNIERLTASSRRLPCDGRDDGSPRNWVIQLRRTMDRRYRLSPQEARRRAWWHTPSNQTANGRRRLLTLQRKGIMSSRSMVVEVHRSNNCSTVRTSRASRGEERSELRMAALKEFLSTKHPNEGIG